MLDMQVVSGNFLQKHIFGQILLFLHNIIQFCMFLCGTRHNERRLLRFGFDDLKTQEIFNTSQKQSNGRCPVGVLYTYPLCLIAIGVSVHQWNYRSSGLLYISAWGFDVARFDLQGNPRASDRGAGNSSGASRFFYVFIRILLKTHCGCGALAVNSQSKELCLQQNKRPHK